MFGIACGYADANDAARLAHDPVFKLLIGRGAVDGHDLESQPTLSRFENTVRPRDLLRMSEALAEAVIKRHKRRKKQVKIRRLILPMVISSYRCLTVFMIATATCRWLDS